MGKYECITEARKLFGIKESQTIREIKRLIKNKIKAYHPDTNRENGEACTEKAASLIKAKEIIMDYLDTYRISFKKEEVEKYIGPDELWKRRFGSDPLWGD
ncbi:MAG: J domain-containing protein [Spirochaetales bacterium]|nr:J domain-containing protein [Spirochaetales bacterium]